MQQAGLFGNVCKSAVPVVVIQRILAVVRNKQVFKAVVVVIADRYCRGPADAFQARFFGDVRKGAVTIILVKAVRGPFRRAFQQRSAQDEDIEPAVVVVIDKGAAAADSFNNVGLMVGGSINDGRTQARLFRNIRKAGVKGQTRRFASGLSFDGPVGNTLRQRIYQRRSGKSCHSPGEYCSPCHTLELHSFAV